jgi:nucleotide-binding universal stress UspA family protein
MRTPPIVVATDGTTAALAAVRWAAREAAHTQHPLLVRHVLDWEWAASRYDFSGREFETARRSAEGIAGWAAQEALAVAPAVAVDTDVSIGDPAAQLINKSGQAALLVVGNRGGGGFAGLHLGSVSQRVATHANCPVVVVRGRPEPLDGPVAVGVDDAASADQVLDAAFTAARRRGVALAAVHSYVPDLLFYGGYLPPAQVHPSEQDHAERNRLTEQLAPWREKYPDVPVEIALAHDSAAATLTDASHRAQLVVVGSRGRGVIAGTLLGSTGLQLLHHTDCPVMIVRSGRRADRR